MFNVLTTVASVLNVTPKNLNSRIEDAFNSNVSPKEPFLSERISNNSAPVTANPGKAATCFVYLEQNIKYE